MFPYVDQLIMDCKLCDPVKHQKYTGGANEEIMKNIRKAAKEHPYFHVRVPLIGGVNNATEDLEAFVRFFKEINGDNVTFEVLSYHESVRKMGRVWMEIPHDQRCVRRSGTGKTVPSDDQRCGT